MEMKVTRFREIMTLLSPAVPKKPTLKALACICVKDKQMIATNLETFITVEVPEADGDFLIPFAQVNKMIQYTHGGEYLKITGKRGKAILAWSEGKYSLPTEDFASFPTVPDFKPTVEEFLDMDTLIPAMVAVLPYAAKESERAVLNGVSLLFGKEMLVAAGDGFRMALKTLSMPFNAPTTAILPLGSVSALEFLWKKTMRTPPSDGALVSVIIAKKHAHVAINGDQGMRFRFGEGTTAFVKLVKGDPPAFAKLIPGKDPILQVQLFAAELERAVRRISASGATMVKLAFAEGKATISAKYEGEEMESTIPVNLTAGVPSEMGLSPKYILEYLKGKEGVINLSWTGDMAPVVFGHGAAPKVVIMPMSLGEKKAKPAEESTDETPSDAPSESPAEATAEVPGDAAKKATEKKATEKKATAGKATEKKATAK